MAQTPAPHITQPHERVWVAAATVASVSRPIPARLGIVAVSTLINDHQFGAEDSADRFADGVIGSGPADQPAEVFKSEPGDVHALIHGELPEGLTGFRIADSCLSVEVLCVNNIDHFVAVDEPLQVLCEQFGDAPILLVVKGCRVWCDHHLRHVPQWRASR